MAEKDEGLALKEIREICDNAVEGLCPEGHFGLDKCPYPGEDDDNSMCGKCYMDLILAKATPIIEKQKLKEMGEWLEFAIGKENLDKAELHRVYISRKFIEALKERGEMPDA